MARCSGASTSGRSASLAAQLPCLRAAPAGGRALAAAAASASPPGPAPYRYNAGEGEPRQKATIEHVFIAGEGAAVSTSGGGAGGGGERPAAPWAVGWQMSERNLVWNDDLKMRLVRRVASQQLGVGEGELDARLSALAALLPGLAPRLARAPPDMLARLAADPGRIADRLLRIKAAFPRADAGAMVGNRLGLLLDGDGALPDFQQSAARLRELLPGVDADRFAEAFPAVLDVVDFEAALEDARRLMPNLDVPAMLRSNPDMVLSLMKGKHLITYDQLANPFT